jgi:hypothetical protein
LIGGEYFGRVVALARRGAVPGASVPAPIQNTNTSGQQMFNFKSEFVSRQSLEQLVSADLACAPQGSQGRAADFFAKRQDYTTLGRRSLQPSSRTSRRIVACWSPDASMKFEDFINRPGSTHQAWGNSVTPGVETASAYRELKDLSESRAARPC